MFLPTATNQLRDQLVELVGSVSQRLGLILNRTGGLPDAERARINAMAAEIASLQSSILDALNSHAFTAPRALRELYDLELQALRSIEQIERYLPLAAAQPRYQPPNAYAPPPQPAWPDHSSAAHLFRDARAYIDVEAVPVNPHQYDGVVPSQLTPTHPPQSFGYGEALRTAVSDLNGYPHHEPQYPVQYEQHAQRAAAPPARALVLVNSQPRPPAVVTDVLPDDALDDAEHATIGNRLRARAALVGDMRVSGRTLGVAVSILACLYVGWSFLASSPPPVQQQATVKTDPAPRVEVADARADAPQRLAAAAVPLTGSRKGPLYVPVIATVSSRDEIEQKLSDLSRVYPDALASPEQATIEPIVGSDGRQWYRAFLLPGRPRVETQKFCQGLREAGHIQCWAKRLSGS